MNSSISFRDPGGNVINHGGRILRAVNADYATEAESFLASDLAQDLWNEGLIPRTAVVPQGEASTILPEAFLSGTKLLLEHEKIFFPTYPSEWAPEMLYAAALLTVDLAERLLQHGMGLKDATPYNVLFRGTRPVFVDLLSFERRDSEDCIWLPLAQFEQTFLLPLLVNSHFGLTLDKVFLSSREGMKPEQVYRMCGRFKRLMPPFLMAVTLPVWLGAARAATSESMYVKRGKDEAKARFVLQHTFKRLRKLLGVTGVSSYKLSSEWSDYDGVNPESGDYCQAKSAFIEDVMKEWAPKIVLDVGCNTGRYSMIASKKGAKVVSIDSDPVVVGRLWCAADRAGVDILPLVVNFASPPPATGWLNGETLSFLERAKGRFEAVFMLAVVHHLLVTERIPLREIMALAAQLTTDLAVIEFVDTTDPMFRVLCRGRGDLFSWYDKDTFEAAAGEFFGIVRSVRLGGSDRWLYLLKKS